MRISDWSSDVCSSDLPILGQIPPALPRKQVTHLRHPHRIVGVGKLQRPNRRPLADEYRDMDEDPDDQRDPNRRQPGLETRIGTARRARPGREVRSEEHTSELQSLMRISYAVFCLKKKNIN